MKIVVQMHERDEVFESKSDPLFYRAADGYLDVFLDKKGSSESLRVATFAPGCWQVVIRRE